MAASIDHRPGRRARRARQTRLLPSMLMLGLVLGMTLCGGAARAGAQGDLVSPPSARENAPGHPSQHPPGAPLVPVAPPGVDGVAAHEGLASTSPPAAGPISPEEAARLAVRCVVPDDLQFTEATLPRLAQRLKVPPAARAKSPLTVVVLGTGSSAGAGVSAPDQAYPARLRRELERVFPGEAFEVRTLARRGARVADMLTRIDGDVVPLKPGLVVWQIGATDAVEGVPINRFGRELQRGLARLEKAGIDVMLMDMQFSPFTGLLINAREYRGYIRWIAKRGQVPLLRRYEMMEYWAEQGIFELEVTNQATADGVHACVAHQAADLIRTAVDEAGR